MARSAGVEPRILEAIDAVNSHQKTILPCKIEQHFGGQLAGRRVAVWGLSFKPRTDDVREAPALVLIDRLLAGGAKVQVHDPEALENVRQLYGDKLSYFEQPYGALEGAEALAIMTEWKEFLQPDFACMRALMKAPVIFDGRNLYNPSVLKAAGFSYHSIGRASVG
jgi:UDPglucose 6-dehydrogenase